MRSGIRARAVAPAPRAHAHARRHSTRRTKPPAARVRSALAPRAEYQSGPIPARSRVRDVVLYQSACSGSRVWDARASRTCTVSLPFCHLHLSGPKPRVFARGYPHQPQTLGQRIRQRRMDRGLTQRTLAVQLGCWSETVAAWERAQREPPARRWPAIERILGPGLVPERDGLPGRVRAARLRLGLTQEELAARAGLDPRTVRNVETGRHRASRRTLGRLAEVLGPV